MKQLAVFSKSCNYFQLKEFLQLNLFHLKSTTVENLKTHFFVFFQLSASDTLAGIAIKYDISVEDLKRSNGLVNDWDLWKKKGQLLYFQNHALSIYHLYLGIRSEHLNDLLSVNNYTKSKNILEQV